MAILDSDQKNYIGDLLAEVFDDFGKSCRLYFKGKMIDCPDCDFGAIGSKPNNAWRHGGPTISSNVTCGFCNGTGKKEQIVTEDITMVINWDYGNIKQVIQILPNVKFEYGYIQTRGSIVDLPKILGAQELEVDLPIGNYVKGRYKLVRLPTDSCAITQGRFYIAYWERIA